MKVGQIEFAMRDGADPHHVAVVIAGKRKRRIEVTESPTGRSVQVWVDGARVFPSPENVDSLKDAP